MHAAISVSLDGPKITQEDAGPVEICAVSERCNLSLPFTVRFMTVSDSAGESVIVLVCDCC